MPFSGGDFIMKSPKKTSTTSSSKEKDAPVSPSVPDGLFPCPTEGCRKVYQLNSSLDQHLTIGACKIQGARPTLLDRAMIGYKAKLDEEHSSCPVLPSVSQPSMPNESVPRGWALQGTKKGARFNQQQTSYLDEKFEIGQVTSHKVDPAVVAREMRCARDESGKRLFTAEAFLTAQQIQSYFSRKASKLRKKIEDNDEERANEDVEAAEDQEAYFQTRNKVLDNVQLNHPIMYDTYNLRSMVKRIRQKGLQWLFCKTSVNTLALIPPEPRKSAKLHLFALSTSSWYKPVAVHFQSDCIIFSWARQER